MSSEDETGEQPRGRVYPLNSKRLTANLMGRIAAALGELVEKNGGDGAGEVAGGESGSRGGSPGSGGGGGTPRSSSGSPTTAEALVESERALASGSRPGTRERSSVGSTPHTGRPSTTARGIVDKITESRRRPKERSADSSRRGKAPPVDSFNGEVYDITFDDWLPALQRASEWNGWSDEETLIQLAGHLRGRALQEWTLLRTTEKRSAIAA